jgi:predicted NUDIX family NTP pyrophosphohydrolase
VVKRSAGIIMYRRAERGVELLLVHFGGPMWAKKDDGAWAFPKGEIEADEDALTAARREFEEELGVAVDGDFVALEPVKQGGARSSSCSRWRGISTSARSAATHS